LRQKETVEKFIGFHNIYFSIFNQPKIALALGSKETVSTIGKRSPLKILGYYRKPIF
jgi:hypothetical protein